RPCMRRHSTMMLAAGSYDRRCLMAVATISSRCSLSWGEWGWSTAPSHTSLPRRHGGAIQDRKLSLKQTLGGQHAVITRPLKKSSVGKNRRDLRIVERHPGIERYDKHTVMHGAGMSGKSFGRLHMIPLHRISVLIL